MSDSLSAAPLSGDVVVLGRFPPPLDGQAIQTERLAALLEPHVGVTRLNLSAEEGEWARAGATFRPDRLLHYVRMAFRFPLSPRSADVVLWTSISGSAIGHARDMLTVLPTLSRQARVFGVVHRGDFADLYRNPATCLSARLLTRRLSGLVFLSDTLAQACAHWVPKHKRFVIPNTLSSVGAASREQAREKARHGPHQPLRLLFLSNMIATKGFADVLVAVAHLHARGVPIRADFAGRWTAETDRLAFERFVDAHDLHAVVWHHGGVDQRTAERLHQEADIFLLPTYYPTEAQPATLIEALAAGTPVIVTRHASLPEMVREDREARFVPSRSPAAIADAVLALRAPAAWRRASTDARERFEHMFAPGIVSAQWKALLIDAGRIRAR